MFSLPGGGNPEVDPVEGGSRLPGAPPAIAAASPGIVCLAFSHVRKPNCFGAVLIASKNLRRGGFFGASPIWRACLACGPAGRRMKAEKPKWEGECVHTTGFYN